MAFGTRGSPWANWRTGTFSGPGASAFTQADYTTTPNRKPQRVALGGRAALDRLLSGQTQHTPLEKEYDENDPLKDRREAEARRMREAEELLKRHADESKPVAVADSYGNTSSVDQQNNYTPPVYPTQASTPPANIPSFDLQTPGPVEQWWTDSKDWFNGPTRYSQWLDKHQDDLNAPTANERLYEEARTRLSGPTNAEREYRNFRPPDIAKEPGFGSYYDRAQAKMVTALNDQLGAIGTYGGSAGLNLVGEKIKDLRSEQALKESDYNLARLGEQRQWGTLGKDLARNADLSGQGVFDTLGGLADKSTGSFTDRFKTQAEAQAAADAGDLARKQAGAVAANTAQAAHLARVTQVFNSVTQAYGGLAGMLGDAYDKVLDGDMSLHDAVRALYLSKSRDDANYAASEEGKIMAQLMQATEAYANVVGSGG